MRGPFGNGGNTESREQTIANGKPLQMKSETLFSERFVFSFLLPPPLARHMPGPTFDSLLVSESQNPEHRFCFATV